MYLAYPHGKDVLKEMLTVNGDSTLIKNDILRKIELEGNADYDETEYKNLMSSGSKTLFSIYSKVAGLDIK